jgi:hypothetical protein
MIYVALGGSSVAAVIGQNLAIMPGQTAYVVIGANTYIAAIATLANSPLNVTPST